MFSARAMGKYFLILHLITTLFKKNYLFSPAEAINGVIWSKNASDFVQIFSIHSFDKMNEQRLSISRRLETHNFNGVELKFTSFPVTNLVKFVSNDTVVTGAHGDIWHVLSSMLNFKIRSVRIDDPEYGIVSKNGSWNGLMGYIYRNETDIIPRALSFPSRLSALDLTLATWATGYRFYIKKQLQYHRTWMTELFSPKLWFSVIGLFFTLVFASFFIHALNYVDKERPESACDLRDHFFYIISIFCNQGWIPKQLEKCSKILVISTRLFSWLLIIAFSSKLISCITQRVFDAPFVDLESFYKDTDYKLIVQPNSFVYSVFKKAPRPIYKRILDSGRLIQASMLEAYEMICAGKYVYFEMQDTAQAYHFQGCRIHFIGKPYYTTPVAAGLVRGFKYRKTIDSGILKLHEFGIIARLKLKWLTKRTTISTTAFESIRFEHVSVIFAMLCFGVLLALAVLTIEKIIHVGHLQQDRHKR